MRLKDFLVQRDMYGRPISVNYWGKDVYQTKLGALFTFVTYAFIVFNLIALSIDLVTGRRQSDSQSTETFDRYEAGSFNLKENSFELAVFPSFFIPDNIARIVANMKYFDKGKFLTTSIPLKKCPTERTEVIAKYWADHGRDMRSFLSDMDSTI